MAHTPAQKRNMHQHLQKRAYLAAEGERERESPGATPDIPSLNKEVPRLWSTRLACSPRNASGQGAWGENTKHGEGIQGSRAPGPPSPGGREERGNCQDDTQPHNSPCQEGGGLHGGPQPHTLTAHA